MTDRPSISAQAGAVRHVAATAPAHLRADLDAAIETLDYHAAHPALMRACAYFLKSAPSMGAVFDTFPEARITAIRSHDDLEASNDDD